MNLVVFPGGGNPDIRPGAYEVIKREAEKYGYERVFNDLRWPGHLRKGEEYDSASSITLPKAVNAAKTRIQEIDFQEPYTIIARCFGCLVALAFVSDISVDKTMIKKLILWAPPPYWFIWDRFVNKTSEENKSNVTKGRGLKADESSFPTIIPVENLIKDVQVPTVIAGGAEDEICTPSFFKLLEDIGKENTWLSFKPLVSGAPHTVDDSCGQEIVSAYAKTIFI